MSAIQNKQSQCAKIQIALALCFLAYGCTSNTKTAPPERTSLCQISKSPKTYDNKSIEFQADIISDGIEGSYLVDPTCADFTLGLKPSKSKVDWNPINRIIHQTGQPGTYDKTISATFTGLFHKGRIKGGLISISNIENVSYQKK